MVKEGYTSLSRSQRQWGAKRPQELTCDSDKGKFGEEKVVQHGSLDVGAKMGSDYLVTLAVRRSCVGSRIDVECRCEAVNQNVFGK